MKKKKEEENDKSQLIQCENCQSWWETPLTIEEMGNTSLMLAECPICNC